MENLLPTKQTLANFILSVKAALKRNDIQNIEFVNLKDKTGNQIHYGDILIDENYNLVTPVVEIIKEEHVLFFKSLKHLNSKLPIGCKSTYSDTLIIIGNLFENSDMKTCNKTISK